jgi:L-ascorbate metabolism protein UlaG (beta-lactamase superfamily)
MIITYLGQSLVKIQIKDKVIAMNPYKENAGKKSTRFGADIVTVSANDSMYNSIDTVQFGNKNPHIIDTPGEYEIGGIYINGVATDTVTGANKGKESLISTTFIIRAEDISLCHLGAQEHLDMSAKASESIENIDILFVPIGGTGVLTPTDAYKLATRIEPKVIIPINEKNDASQRDGGNLSQFLHELGVDKRDPLPRLAIKKNDLEGRESDVILLAA